METVLIKALQLIAALTILVFIHEFGHYFFSRVFKVKVERFYLFFHPWFNIVRYNPRANGKKWRFFCANDTEEEAKQKNEEMYANSSTSASWRDTEYGIGWVPLGGYCKIAGMIDESMDTEQMKRPAKAWEFRSKPAYQRLLIMVGGVLFNFLLAIAVYSGIAYCYGEEYIPFSNATEGMIYCDSAHNIGFEDGDIPLSADGVAVNTFDDFTQMIMSKNVTVLRNHTDTVSIAIPEDFVFRANDDAKNGQLFMTYRVPVVIKEVQVRMGAEKAGLKAGDRILAVNGVSTPGYDLFKPELDKNANKTIKLTYLRDGKTLTSAVEVDDLGKIGIMLCQPVEVFETVKKSYNLLQSIPRGVQLGWDKLTSYVSSLKLIFTKEGAQSLGGFGTIGSIFPNQWDWLSFWFTTAFLSVILAVMNILPIPALDGGHVLFLLWEIITRRKPSEKVLERAQVIGMIFLFALLLYANANDIYRFFIK
ncbi:MAG: RIP metalloprotease RseP [Muribaculaceae bacterium]